MLTDFYIHPPKLTLTKIPFCAPDLFPKNQTNIIHCVKYHLSFLFFLSKSQSQGTTHSPISFNFYHGLCGSDTSSLCRCCLGLCRLEIFRYGGRVKIVKFDSLGTDNVLLNNNDSNLWGCCISVFFFNVEKTKEMK
jgi:hypothetical protein